MRRVTLWRHNPGADDFIVVDTHKECIPEGFLLEDSGTRYQIGFRISSVKKYMDTNFGNSPITGFSLLNEVYPYNQFIKD